MRRLREVQVPAGLLLIGAAALEVGLFLNWRVGQYFPHADGWSVATGPCVPLTLLGVTAIGLAAVALTPGPVPGWHAAAVAALGSGAILFCPIERASARAATRGFPPTPIARGPGLSVTLIGAAVLTAGAVGLVIGQMPARRVRQLWTALSGVAGASLLVAPFLAWREPRRVPQTSTLLDGFFKFPPAGSGRAYSGWAAASLASALFTLAGLAVLGLIALRSIHPVRSAVAAGTAGLVGVAGVAYGAIHLSGGGRFAGNVTGNSSAGSPDLLLFDADHGAGVVVALAASALLIAAGLIALQRGDAMARCRGVDRDIRPIKPPGYAGSGESGVVPQ